MNNPQHVPHGERAERDATVAGVQGPPSRPTGNSRAVLLGVVVLFWTALPTAVAPADVFSMANGDAGLVVTLVGLLGAVLSVVRWRNKPQFVCGVLPLEAELKDPRFALAKLGQQSLTKAFRFEQKYFAMRLRRSDVADLAPAFRSRLRTDLSCRNVTVSDGGTMSLPVILANYGGRTATGLTCSVILSAPGSKVKLCDAEVESLNYRVFALDQTLLREHAKTKSAPMEVVDAYTRVLTYIPVGDGVWLWGDLNANSFEVICLTLKVEVPSTWFELLFTINCSDGFVRAETYVQAIHVQAGT